MLISLRFSCGVLLFASGVFSLPAAAPPLLDQAAKKWLGERDNWAFTMVVREFDGGQVKEERRERYDPSRPGSDRWALIAVNGGQPSDERRAEWQKRKSKKRKNPGKPLGDYLDFERSTVVNENVKTVCYQLPLRDNHSWLFPVDKVSLKVTINKATLAIEVIEAGIDEPFKVALGFARVLDVDFDLQMNPPKRGRDKGDPAVAKPEGTAQVVVKKLGERIEYAWSEFKRVTPHRDNVIADSPAR